LAGEEVELGNEVTSLEPHDRATVATLDVEGFDLALEDHHEVVAEIAGGRQYLAGRDLLDRAVGHQRSDLLVRQLREQLLCILRGHEVGLLAPVRAF